MMETRVRAGAREIINGLKNANDTENITKWLNAARFLIVKDDETKKIPVSLQHLSDVPLAQLRSIFKEQHFGTLCGTILDLVTLEWVQKLPGNYFSQYVEFLFVAGPAADALLALDHAVQRHRQGFKLHKTTALLELFINKGRLLQMVWDQCQLSRSSQGQQPQALLSGHSGIWDELVVTLASLPSRMANCLGRENSDVFLPQNYVPCLGRCILECLQRTRDLVADSKDCSLEFVSRLVGKLCFTGYADLLLDVLVPVLCSSVTRDYVWCRVCERVITGVPPLSMESVIVPLLTKIPWYEWVGKFLGDCIVHNQKVRFLVCTKLLFHRYFSQVLLLQNLIGYLASSHTRRHLYHEVFRQLLGVWGDASSLRHVSTEQHLFLCHAILICVSHVGQQEQQQYKQELIQLLVPGVQSHLGSTDVAVRTRGMLVARELTKTVDPTGPQIEFEIPKTSETEDLEKLLLLPPDPGLEKIQHSASNPQDSDWELSVSEWKPADNVSTESECDSDTSSGRNRGWRCKRVRAALKRKRRPVPDRQIRSASNPQDSDWELSASEWKPADNVSTESECDSDTSSGRNRGCKRVRAALKRKRRPVPDRQIRAVDDLKLSESQETEEVPRQPDGNTEDLDSDDDLVPCDMSFDKKTSKVKSPKYIRDCMEGLLSTQEVDKFEASLKVAESLIRSRPDGINEIAGEFTKILLHTTETCGIEDFISQRFRAMVALGVQCPKEVAQYLTSQFYERNYCVRQRLDILEVLTAAAQELSQPDHPKTKQVDNSMKSQPGLQPHSTHPETWRQVVQRRIDSKTRRFGKGRSQPEPVATANRFGDVAGEFFFPLMRFYDRNKCFFDLLSNDSLVLNRLVYSLAIILHAAVHTTAARQMGKILLEFTWSLRMHHDVNVRQAVLVATSIILLVLPSHYLLTDLQVDMMETKAWLEGVMEKEVNEECKKLGAQGLTLLESVIAKEMQGAVENT